MTVRMALVAKTRGLAYLIEEDGQLLDWRVKRWRNERNKEKLLDYILQLIHLGDIQEVLLPTELWEGDTHARGFLEELIPHLLGRSVTLTYISTSDQRRRYGNISREDRAIKLSFKFPELRAYIPRRKRIWESESSNLLLFDAASLL